MRWLNKFYSVLLLGLIVISGCEMLTEFNSIDDYNNNSITGSGNLITISKPLTGFNSIEASHTFELNIIQSDVFNVDIELDDNLLEYLTVEKNGDKLILGLRDINSTNNVTLRADISMPDIGWIRLSGASKLDFADMKLTRSLTLNLSGASSVTGKLIVEELYAGLSDASYISFTGNARKINIEGSGASMIAFENFIVNDALIFMSGASFITLNVTDYLSAYLSGASVLGYYGNPAIGVLETSGGAYIRKL